MIGNQNVPAYSFIPTMAVNNKYNGWISNGNYVTAITSIPSLVSRNFTWEKVGTLDIGIDFSMFSIVLQVLLTGISVIRTACLLRVCNCLL